MMVNGKPLLNALNTLKHAWKDKALLNGNAAQLKVAKQCPVARTYFHGTVQRTNTVPATTFACSPAGKGKLAKSERWQKRRKKKEIIITIEQLKKARGQINDKR